MSGPGEAPSRSQVKKAGKRIRRFMRGDDVDIDHFIDAVDVMELWRRAHYTPLVTANNGLRSFARTVGVEAEVTQRLKRRQTILDKLRREPTLDLSTMQDIGGCRAVVGNVADLRTLEAHIRKRRPVNGEADYVVEPRLSGYRGVHIIVEYQDRNVEIQLRTETMHSWALAAEHYSSVLGENLKQDGDHPVQLFLESASRIMAHLEYGEQVPKDLADLHSERRIAALPHIP